MKRILTILTLLTILTSAQASVTPAYAPHNRVPGNTPTMTNIQAWASALVTSGISAETATNIADAVVASSNLCSVAAARAMTNATLSAAKQDAAAKYLPLTGGTLAGGLTASNFVCIVGDDLAEDFVMRMWYESAGPSAWIDIGPSIDYFGFGKGYKTSELHIDGTDVMTAGAVSNFFPIVTNAYTKAEADALLATKQATISDLSTIRSQASGALPKDGNTPMSGNKLYLFNGQGETTGFVLDNMGVLHVKNVNATGTMKFYGRVETPSDLDVDGSPVATSNMVVAVVDDRADKAVTTAVDNQMKAILGDNWKTTYGGGLAGLVAAIVAALTWLKSNKLTKGMTAGVPDDPNVSSLFTSANTSLMGVCRYGTASAATDRKVATIVVTPETGAVALPTPTSGAVTDVVVLLDCRGVAEIPSGLTFTGNILWSGGSAVAPVAGKMMAYGFTCDGTSQASSSLCYVGNGITCG